MKIQFQKIVVVASVLMLVTFANAAWLCAQDAEAQDEVSQQASQLEASLGKYRDTSPGPAT